MTVQLLFMFVSLCDLQLLCAREIRQNSCCLTEVTLMGKQIDNIFAVLQKYCGNANEISLITCLSVWLQTK